jgi:hypothetical protein
MHAWLQDADVTGTRGCHRACVDALVTRIQRRADAAPAPPVAAVVHGAAPPLRALDTARGTADTRSGPRTLRRRAQTAALRHTTRGALADALADADAVTLAFALALLSGTRWRLRLNIRGRAGARARRGTRPLHDARVERGRPRRIETARVVCSAGVPQVRGPVGRSRQRQLRRRHREALEVVPHGVATVRVAMPDRRCTRLHSGLANDVPVQRDTPASALSPTREWDNGSSKHKHKHKHKHNTNTIVF